MPLLVVVASVLSTAAADILHVPGDFPTIQEAIDAAVDGDEVEVHPGTYNEAIDFLGKAIRVYSTDGPDVTIIDAQQTGTVVTCESAEGPDSVLEGFTITGGNADFGGGMRIINSCPTVTNCTFSGNTATDGGGMLNGGSSPTLTNCTFSGNTASGKGGAMFNVAGIPALSNCVFSGNVALDGGGMCNKGSSPLVTDCTFSGNAATDTGGGMYNTQASNPTVTNCTFSQNTVSNGFGGGMSNWYTSATVTNCTFSGNSASRSGGGMTSGDTVTVTNCTFIGNTAGSGGGMRNREGTTVINCTFIGNTATSQGGGMYNSTSSSATVINCTFSQNTADFGGGGMYNFQTTSTVTNCVLWNNSPDGILNVNGGTFVSFSDVQGGYPGEGNIDADPLFVDPDNDDYHLSPGSPCIDASDNTAVPEGIDTDLDGNDRFVDTLCTDDTGKGKPPVVDMGAYEFQLFQVTCPWDLDCNGSVGASDLLSLLVSWGPCKGCPADFDVDGTVGATDLLALLVNWGPCP